MRKPLERNSDAEEARIQRGIALDPDNPEWTAEDFRRARPASEVMPELVDAWRRGRGKQKAPTKVAVSLRLDEAVVDRLRASGPGWQTRANEMLRKAVLGS
jgi:uncharacterized protein (DUF4415 family)